MQVWRKALRNAYMPRFGYLYMNVRREVNEAFGDYIGRGFKLFIVLFLIELAILGIVAAIPFFPGEYAAYTQTENGISGGLSHNPMIQYAQIFTNNAAIAVGEMIPAFGVLLYGIGTYNTARILEIIAVQHSISAPYLYLSLISLPHSLIELSAYALAAAEGIYIAQSIGGLIGSRVPGSDIKREAKFAMLTLFFSMAILAIADVFEVSEGVLGAYAAIDYVPYALLLVWFFGFMKAHRRTPASGQTLI